jgi:hypothetical protein
VNPIRPVRRNARSAAVADLHAGLLFLIRNQPGISAKDRRLLQRELARELRARRHGKCTAHLVARWQEQLAARFDLRVTGEVDQATADALNAHLAELGAGIGPDTKKDALSQECQKLLATLRERCPGVLPAEPLKAGAVTKPIEVKTQEAAGLIAVAARQAVLEAAGAPVPSDPKQLPQSVLWQDGADALIVEVGTVKVTFAPGAVTVALPVRCDQLPKTRGVIEVDLLFGLPDRPTGLLAAAAEPRGPAVVVRRWSDALTALAWQAVLNSIGGVTAAAGSDQDGHPLIPAALTATASGVAVLAQARHEIDRLRPGKIVGARL